MSRIRGVVVVHNPNSSGDGDEQAVRLRDELADARRELPVELRATEHPGHGREIAAEVAGPGVLVVSASGDGGYHDVVNGLMAAGTGLGAVLPAGNANDHRTATGRRPLAEAIAADDVTEVDLLTVQRSDNLEYAHSYVGLGLTPSVAVALEQGGKGSLREIGTTLRVLRDLVPVELELEGRVQQFNAVVCSSIDRMAKYVKLPESAEPDDGRFEVVEIGRLPGWRLPEMLIRAAVGRLPHRRNVTRYEFTTPATIPVQLDGEVRDLQAGERVVVGIAPRALATVR